MTEKDARAEIVKLLAVNNWFMVIWVCHFVPRRIVILSGKNRKPEVYSAIFEQFWDVIGDAEEIGRFVPKSKTWRGLRTELYHFSKKSHLKPTKETLQ